MGKPIVQFIADYGPVGDLAWSEAIYELVRSGPDGIYVIPTVVPTFSETAMSFAAYQIGLRVRDEHEARTTIIFTNVDARTHTKSRITNGDGNPLFLGTLKGTCVRIIGPGLTTFAIAEQAKALHSVAVIDTTPWNHRDIPGQFRSRDIFSQIVRHLLTGGDVSLAPVERNEIPQLPPCIGLVDGYENVKTNIPRSAVTAERVRVRIGAIEHTIRRVPSLFALYPGELGIYPGSSGSPENPFLELAVRYDARREPLEDTGTKRFGNPKPGSSVTIVEAPVVVPVRQ